MDARVGARGRAQIAALAAAVQKATGSSAELAYVEQGDAGSVPQTAAQEHGIRPEVVKHTAAKRGFVLFARPSRG